MTEPSELKRGRGRPKGASRLNETDSLILARIADVIVATPMRPTTAMRRLNIHNEAETRRLQRKWRKSGSQHLEAAERRRQHARPSPQEILTGITRGVQAVARHLAPVMERFQDWMNSPEVQKMAERAQAFIDSPQYQRLRAFAESPEAERLREVQIAQAKRLQAIAESPSMKQLRKKLADPKLIEQMGRVSLAVDQFPRVALIPPAALGK
jgi:hypothetical protein